MRNRIGQRPLGEELKGVTDAGYASSVEWAYKATATKLDHAGTVLLADARGFLCRSAYDASGARVGNVRKVSLGDTIHFYYVDRSRVRPVGSFEVIDRDQHPRREAIGERVPETALFSVEQSELITEIDRDGAYQPDPTLGVFTGWLLRRVGPPPPYRAAFFPSQATLIEYVPAP